MKTISILESDKYTVFNRRKAGKIEDDVGVFVSIVRKKVPYAK
jgi:hypothetical protein